MDPNGKGKIGEEGEAGRGGGGKKCSVLTDTCVCVCVSPARMRESRGYVRRLSGLTSRKIR